MDLVKFGMKLVVMLVIYFVRRVSDLAFLRIFKEYLIRGIDKIFLYFDYGVKQDRLGYINFLIILIKVFDEFLCFIVYLE